MQRRRARIIGLASAGVVTICGVAWAADSTIEFPGLKMHGAFGHTGSFRAESNLQPPYVYAQVGKGSWGSALTVHALMQDGQYIDIKITDPTNRLLTVPQRYPIADNQSPGDKYARVAYATIEYHGTQVCWSKEGGTLTLTALGAIDGPVTGTLEGVKWGTQGGSHSCDTLGATGTFATQRAIDR
jgi:hypothetical protein